MSLEKRLERLERQNRRFKQGIVLAVVLAASALLAGAAGRLPRNIATHQLTILDSQEKKGGEGRLERLERQNRRFKQGIVLAVVLAASALLAGAAGRLPRNIATHQLTILDSQESRRYQGGEGRSAVHILAGFRRNIPQHAVRISKRRRINRLSRPEREGPPLDGRVSGLAANQLYQRRGKTHPDHPVRGTERSPPRGKWLKNLRPPG